MRGTIGSNPYHNQHIQEIASAMEESINEITQHYDPILMEILVVLEKYEALAARVEALEKKLQEKPIEVDANVTLNQKSVKDLRAKIMSLFR